MKLLRVGAVGQERPCVLDAAGQARDVSSIVPDFAAELIGDDLLARLAAADLQSLPAISLEGARIAPPVARPPNIYCIGLNYSDHAAEAGLPVPDEPILFNKSYSSYCGPNDPIPWTDTMSKLDWEVELGIVIGCPALGVDADTALDCVFGYTIVNDVSERHWQGERGGQWTKGKSFPNFCPAGPWLVTRDEIPDPQALDMWLTVNGQPMQSGNTARMIFPVAAIVAYLSQFMRLEPGDLICSGTPPGVGIGRTPPVFLTAGDIVALGIAGLGNQRQIVTRLEEIAS